MPVRQVGPDDGVDVAVPAFDVCGLVAFRPAQSLASGPRRLAAAWSCDRAPIARNYHVQLRITSR